MKIKKTLLSFALSGAMVLGLMPGMTMTAFADEPTTSYTLTIPSMLTVTDKGWNATGGISVTGTLTSGKKLTVTASSKNSWALKSGDNTVGYTLTTAEGGSQTTFWEFTTLDGTAQPMGIIVEDYSSKPAGTYQDVVTFTATVTDLSVAVTGVTLNKTSTTLTVGGGTETLTATVAPNNATDRTVTWSSSNTSVATVTNGVVTPVAAGSATITVTTADGSKTATCTVTVEKLTTLAELLTNNAVVKVVAAKSNNSVTYTVQGTYNDSSFGSVTQGNSMNMDALNKGATLTKSGNNLVAEIKTTYGNITFTFDTANNTYTLTTSEGGKQNSPTILNSITVNGNAVTVTKSN